ncbi:hypothetical protein HN747_01275 [archaeon]|nr:hypothetical protein [archaeon]
MANIGYIWQLVNSLEDATEKLEKSLNGDNQSTVSRLKSFIFEVQQQLDTELKKHD